MTNTQSRPDQISELWKVSVRSGSGLRWLPLTGLLD